MELKDLHPAEGSRKARKRVGRGAGSGTGKTAGRGLNGQKSRAGGGKGVGFEGGQTPLARRLPKLPGFRNINRVEYLPVNVSRIEKYYEAGEVVDGESLAAKGIIKKSTALVKVLGDGEITKAVTVKVDKVSATAKAKIEAAEERSKSLAKFSCASIQGARAEEQDLLHARNLGALPFRRISAGSGYSVPGVR